MKGLIEGSGHKYLSILQADKFQRAETKEKMKYLRRFCKILETKLNGGNRIKEINTWQYLVGGTLQHS